MFMKSICGDQKPVGPYSPAVKLGDFVYVSGQLPLHENGEMDETIELQVHCALDNLKKLLNSVNLEMRHIVKTTLFLTDMKDFEKVNEIYSEYFTEPYPARSCVEVKALPKGAKFEIEALVIDTLVYENQMQSSCSCSEKNCGGCKQ